MRLVQKPFERLVTAEEAHARLGLEARTDHGDIQGQSDHLVEEDRLESEGA